MRTNKILIAVFTLFIGISVLNSCNNIGLGESVDTEAPVLTIEYPSVDVIIRDEFVLSGTSSDDKGLASVEVTITNTDTSKSYGSYDATIDEDSETWSIHLNSSTGVDDWGRTTWTFPDGNYSVDVTAHDDAGRDSGTSSRTFSIDNTAPIFILNNPSSIDSSNPAKYGKTFKVEGTIADDNTVKTMNVNVYKDGTLKHTYSESNIETAGGSSVTLAEYESVYGNSSDENSNYKAIYDFDSSEETQTFSCSIELVDSARQYTNSDTDSTTGNATTACFLYDDIYDTVMSSAGLGLEASEIKDIINGTTSSEDVLNILYGDSSSATDEGIKTDTESSKAYFSLNPEASPTFKVVGYDITSKSLAATGYSLSVQTIAGEDGTLFDPSTLTAYIFGPFDSMPDYLSDLYANPEDYDGIDATDGTKDTNDDVALQVSSNSDYSGSSVDSYIFEVKIDPEDEKVIEEEKYYYIVETGYDKDLVDVEPNSDYYGFIGTVSGNPPTITVTSPDDLSVVASGAQTFSGAVTTDTSGISALTYTVAVTDESGTDTGYSITGNGTIEGTSDATWSFDVIDGSGYVVIPTGKQYLYTVTVKAKDASGNSSEVIRRVHVDTTKPVVKISSVTPKVTRSSDGVECVNGIVTVGGKITESNLSSVTLTVSDGTASKEYDLGAVYSFEQTVDTTAYADGATLTFTLSAEDEAGNVNSTTATTTNIPTLSYTIDQSTDNPVISLSNADTSISDSSAIDATTGNLFGTVSNNKLLGTITDDDGIASVVVSYKAEVDTSYTIAQQSITGTPTTYSLSYTLPNVEGAYNIKIAVTDSVGTSTSYNTTEAGLVVVVDDGAPVFSTVSPSNYKYYKDSLPVSGTVTDGGTITLTSNVGETGATSNPSIDTDGSWTDTITLPDTSDLYTITYTATDNYGQSSTYTLSYYVDETAPILELTSPLENESIDGTGTILTGKVTDAGSGIATLTYEIDDADGISVSADSITPGSNGSWSSDGLNLASSFTSEGDLTVTIIANDKLGNTATINSRPFYYDTGSPTLTETGIGARGLTTNAEFTLSGTASDTNGLDTITIADDISGDTWTLTCTDGTWSSSDGISTDSGDTTNKSVTWSKTITADSATDGDHTYTITATDVAANAVSIIRYVTVDTQIPEILSVDFEGLDEDATYYKSSQITVNSVTFASDSDDITNISYIINDSSTDAGALSFTSSWTGIVNLGEAINSIVFTASDTAGNTTTFSKSISVDAVDPTSSVTATTIYDSDGIGVGTESVEFGGSYLAKAEFTIGGTITEAHFDSATFSVSGIESGTISIDSSGAISLSDGATVSLDNFTFTLDTDDTDEIFGSWEYTQPVDTADTHTNDGSYTYTLEITDKASREFEKSITVSVDTTAPSLEVTSPKIGESAGATTYTIKGTVGDDGSDVASLRYRVYSGSTASGDFTTVENPSASWKLSDVDLGSSEGNLTLEIYAKDILGNETETFSATDKTSGVSSDVTTDDHAGLLFYYDTGAPTVSVDGNTIITVNSNFTLSGSASDTNGLQSIEITDSEDDTNLWTFTYEDFTIDTADINSDGDADESTTWSQTITPYNIDSTVTHPVSDGEHLFTIKVLDAANNATTKTKTVTVDTVKPVIEGISFSNTLENSYYQTKSLTVSGITFTDADDVNTVNYSINDNSDTATWESIYYLGDAWSGSISLSEGESTIYFKATDAAGNISDVYEESVKVDIADPTSTISTTDSFYDEVGNTVTSIAFDDSYITNEAYTLSGIITEANLKTATLTVEKDGSGVSGSPITISDKIWSYEQTVAETGHSNDGEYTYTLAITDKAEKTFNKTISVIVDTTDPDILEISTINGIALDTENSEYVNSSSGTIVGTADDSGSGIKSVSYTVNAGSSQSSYVSGSNWTINLNSLSDASSYALSITATDFANNTTTINKTIYVDTTAPISTITADDTAATTNSGLYTSSGTVISDTDATSSIVFGSTYLSKTGFTLKGTITETNFATATLTVTKDGTSNGSTFTSGGDSAGEWTYTQTVDTTDSHSNDGLYVYTLNVTDKAGLVFEKLISVRVDTTAPVLSITYPATGEFTESNTYTLKGSVIDAGSGGETVSYQLNSGASVEVSPIGSTWTASDVDLGTDEGTVILTATAQDILGNETDTQTVTFYYDTAKPTLSETGIGVSGLTTNSEFTLTGTVSDTNGLSSVVITDDSSDNTWTFDETGTSASWEQSITPASDHSDDGTHVYTITVTDAANKTTSKTRTVTIDTESPNFEDYDSEDDYSSSTPNFATPTYTFTDTDTSEKFYYNSTQVSVTLGVSDDTSGISGVYYTTTYSEDSETWVSLTKKTTTDSIEKWAGNITSSEGQNSIYIKVEDVAGNSDISTLYTAYVDTTDPEVALSTVDGVASVSSKLVNGKSDVIVTGTTSDSGTYASEVASVSLYIGSTEVVTEQTVDDDGTWSITLLADDLESGTVYAVATDNVSNESSKTSLFTIQLDNTAPKASISTPSSSSEVNGKKDFSGAVTEDNPLSIALYYATTPSTILDSNWTLYKKITTESGTDTTTIDYDASVSSIYNWNITDFNFGSLVETDGTATVYILPVAADKAGNSSVGESIAVYDSGSADTGYYTYTVDQDTDRPVVKLSNLSLTDMASTNYVWFKQNTTLYGTLTDDDGIDSLVILYKFEDDSAFYGLDSESNETTEIDDVVITDVSNGAWEYTLPSGDGSYTLKFIVTDTEGSLFKSSESATTSELLDTPKITDGSNEFGYSISSADTMLYLIQDTNSPEVDITGLSTDNGTSWTTSSYSSLTLGGAIHLTNETSVSSTKTFQLKTTSSDANGISSISLITSGLKDSDGEAIEEATYTGVGMTTEGAIAGGDDDISYYLFSNIDCSSGSGTMVITVTATDTASNTSADSISVSVDNTAPIVSVISPSSETTSSGSVTAYGTLDETADVYYAVSVSGTQSPGEITDLTQWEDNDGISTDLLENYSGYSSYAEIADASFSWYTYFDGDTDTSQTTTHASLLNDYLVSLGITTTDNLEDNNFTNVVKLYVWIKAEDKAGNITETPHLILLDPQGGRPTVTLSYPDENGISLGGAVRLYGSATDDSSVQAVFVQFVSEQHNLDGYTERGSASYSSITATSTSVPTLTESDVDYMASIGTVYEISTYGTEDTNTTWSVGDSPADFDGTDWGLLSSFSGSSWSLELNDSDELNPSSDTTNAVGFRVYAIDNDDEPTKSVAVERIASFDADNPVISDVYLVQSSGAGYATANTASIEYTDDMWVKDAWYVTGTITDADSIKTLKIGGASLISNTSEVSSSNWDVEILDDGQTIYYKYKLNTETGIGNLTFNISATDGASPTAHTTDKAISINYDNTAPSLIVSGDDYQIDPKVSQSNNFYTFGSQVSESASGGENQSGFARTAVYFLRRDLTATDSDDYTYTVFDPMISTDTSGNTIDISGAKLSTDSLTDGDIVYNEGMYWKYKTISRDADNLSSLTLGTTDANIHTGGLVEIGNALYTIDSVSGTSVTIDGSPESSYTTAYFAMALIVDHTTTESSSGSISTTAGYGYGYYSSPLNDDGDLMIEGVSKSGTTWTWEANICSKNIPDGPIEIHYVVYDEAGNYSIGTSGNVDSDTYSGGAVGYATKEITDSNNSYYVYDDYNETYTEDTPAFVSNNAPRIAGVQVGTDLDGNGGIDDDEWDTTYAASEISGDVYDVEDLETSITLGSDASPLLTAKGYTEVKPEIVGGNGDMYYSYSYSGGDSSTESGNNDTTALGIGTTDDTLASLSSIKLQIGDLLKAGTTDATLGSSDNVPFDFKIWDSTAATTTFTNSQHADITLYMGVKLKDETAPTASITPFHWVSSSDNSLYANSSENGHIELEDDWLTADGYDSSTTGEYDDDPKVSGQIVITGSAHDNKQLSALYISIPGMETQFTASGITTTTAVDSVTYYLMATCTDGTWTGVDEFDDYGFKFAVDNNVYDSDGQTATWTLSWNTAELNTISATDVNVQVLALDQGSPTATEGSGSLVSIDGSTLYTEATYSSQNNSEPSESQTTSTTETSLYTVDVVPYISGLTTNLSSLKSNNPSVYDRTALGKYSVAADETITVNGFNLDFTTIDASSYTASGEIALSVNGVSTLNNSNNNTIKYNQQHNGDNNDLLTDDINLDIWDIDSTAVRSISGDVADPVMKINPVSGMIGFAFVNGPLYYSMGGKVSGTEYSYYYWMASYDRMTSISFAYDSNGNSYGTAAGGDTNSTQADKFVLATDRWGISDHDNGGSYDGTNTLRFESIGQKGDSDGNNTTTTYFDSERIKSPSYASVDVGVNTNMYMAYYDNLNDEIRFRYGSLADTNTAKTGFNNFVDDETSRTPTNYATNTTNVSMIAGASTGRNPGEYVSIGVIPENTYASNPETVVAVWYDATANDLLYSYNITPTTDAKGSKDGAAWTTPITVFDGAGENCQLVVDINGGIHIAAYDITNADLKYAYLSTYAVTSVEDTCTVDSYGVVGTHLTLDVALDDSGNAIPYIGYYASSCGRPKYAYKINTSSNAPAGVTNEAYTGDWEVSVVPTSSRILQDRINVAVWKDASSGKLKVNPLSSNTNAYTENSSGYNSTSWGKVYGNESSNAILGYSIRNGSSYYIETAQKK